MKKSRDDDVERLPGAGVDARGMPVLDPTKNVLGLVEAANKRTDDLAALREIIIIERDRRIEDLLNEKIAHVEALAKIREEAQRETARQSLVHRDQLYNGLIDTLHKVADRVGTLEQAVARDSAKGEGQSSVWAMIVSAASFVSVLILIGVFVFSGHPSTPTVPQIVLVPAQPGTMVQQPAPNQQR